MARNIFATLVLSSTIGLWPATFHSEAAQIDTPAIRALCSAAQSAVWDLTDERWERALMQPGDINCVIVGVEAFCPSCAPMVSVVLTPPAPAAAPNENRQYQKMGFGPAGGAEEVRPRYSQAVSVTLSAPAGTMVAVVSSPDAAYARTLSEKILRRFRKP